MAAVGPRPQPDLALVSSPLNQVEAGTSFRYLAAARAMAAAMETAPDARTRWQNSPESVQTPATLWPQVPKSSTENASAEGE